MIYQINIPANPNISEIGKNERKYFKRYISEFPIHYYRQILAKIGTHGKTTLFFFFFFALVKIGMSPLNTCRDSWQVWFYELTC